MRRPIVILTVVSLTLALLTGACSSEDSSSGGDGPTTSATAAGDADDTLLGTWTLTSYSSNGATRPAADPPAVLVLSGDGTYTGTTGCNTTGGRWTGDADGPTTFELGPTTLIGCTDAAVVAQEAALTTNLGDVTDSVLDGDTMSLQNASGATLFSFDRAS